jgi:uncharacterized RDD family membrane protein YckC
MSLRMMAAVAAALAGAAPSRASGLPLDLGRGLSYYRVHALPADLPPAPSGRPGPSVLDLRFAKADGAGAALLSAWVRFNASASAPVFVLENSETSPALTALFPGTGAGDVIVLAPASEKLSPTVAVHVEPAVDRQAYDAVEKGAALASLLSDNPAKPRIDEAYLDKEHLSDSDAPDVETDKPSPPSPLVDAMVQRAVQLHRGLIALKRI